MVHRIVFWFIDVVGDFILIGNNIVHGLVEILCVRIEVRIFIVGHECYHTDCGHFWTILVI